MASFAKLGFVVDSSQIAAANSQLKVMAKDAKRAESSTFTLANSVKVLGSAFASLGAVGVVRQILEVNKEAQRLNASLITVTGSIEGANAAWAQLEEFASTTPYALTQSIEAFTKMKALGLDPTTESLRSFGNTSAAMGKDLMQMIEAVADASTGEFERLKEFGIRAKTEGDTIRFIFQGTETVVRNSAANITSYLQAIGENEFAGAMARQMETLGGAASNLGDNFDRLLRSLGGAGANSALSSGILSLSEAVGSAAENMDTLLTVGQGVALVYGGRVASSLGASALARTRDSLAATAQAKAAAAAAAAELDFLRVAQRSLLSQLENNRATATGIKLRQQLAANTASLTSAQNAYTSALARSTAAARASAAATGLASGAMALLGGPAGVVIIAAGALYYFATRASDGEKLLGGFNRTLDETIGKFEELAAAQRRVAIADLAEELADAQALLEAQQGALSSYGGPGDAMDRQLARIEEQQKAVDDLQEKYDELAGVQRRSIDAVNSAISSTVNELAGLTNIFEPMVAGAGVLRKEIQEVPIMLRQAYSAAGEETSKATDGFKELMQSLEEQRILFEEGEIAAYRYSLAVKGFTPEEVDAAAAARKTNMELEASIEKREEFNDAMEAWAKGQHTALKSAEQAEKQYAQSLMEAINPMGAFEAEAQKIQDVFDKGLLGDTTQNELDAYIAKLREAAEEAAGINEGFNFSALESGLGTTVDELAKIQGAMEDGSKGAKKLEDVMTALSVAQGAAAIANAMATGDPYTAVARAFAVAATLAAAGIQTGVSGGASTAAADAQATQGTGGVLGDSQAQSESIMKAAETTADATRNLVAINTDMRDAIRSMAQGIEGATANILRGRDFTSSTGSTPFTEVGDPLFGDLNLRQFDFMAALGLDFIGDFLNDALGGSSETINSGIAIAGGRINDLINNTLVSAFQEVEEKKHFLDDKDVRRFEEALGSEVGAQFSLVFGSMVDAVSAAAEVLGIAQSDIQSRISSFQIAATEISLMDLTGEEQQAELEAVFGQIFDDLANAVIPYASDFQQVGEGIGETLVRVATQIQVADELMGQLGNTLLDGLSGQAMAEGADNLVKAFGGLENFMSQIGAFVDEFATDEHKLAIATDAINSAFAQMGEEVPATADGVWALMQTLTDPADIARLAGLTDALSEYYDAIAEAEREQAAINAQREGLTIQLLRLQGKEEEALALERARALEGLDESNRALQEQIWAIQDAKNAEIELAEARMNSAQMAVNIAQELADAAVGATDTALANLRTAVDREKDAVTAEHDARMAAAQAAMDRSGDHIQRVIDRTKGSISALRGLSDALMSAVQGNLDQSIAAVAGRRMDAQQIIRDALSGSITNIDQIRSAAGVLGQGADTRAFATSAEFMADQARTANELQALAGKADLQASAAERTVMGLERRNASAQAQHQALIDQLMADRDAQLMGLEQIFLDAEEQVNALRGIEDYTGSINDALVTLESTMATESATQENLRVQNEILAELKASREENKALEQERARQQARIEQLEKEQRDNTTQLRGLQVKANQLLTEIASA